MAQQMKGFNKNNGDLMVGYNYGALSGEIRFLFFINLFSSVFDFSTKTQRENNLSELHSHLDFHYHFYTTKTHPYLLFDL